MTESATDVLRSVLTDLDPADGHYLLNPPRAFLDAFAVVGTELDEIPMFRILVSHDVARWARDTFPTAARIQTLVDTGLVEFREGPVEAYSSAIVSQQEVFSLVAFEGTARQFHTGDAAFATDAHSECVDLWTDAEPYSLRAPALPQALAQAELKLGQEFQQAFEESLGIADEFDNPQEFHPVRATLLLAAAQEILHYKVSKWGENVGLASSASYSRHKTTLESDGVIETEKVQVEIGRPRQRLFLTEEYRQRIDEEGVDAVLREVARVE